jgi:riboflavin kinase/FMN adenylyltransferase
MRIITIDQANKIQFNKASVALGTFDGLHLGHMALIDAAKKHDGDTIAFTFDALPVDVFRKKHKPMQLYTLVEKESAFEKTGIDYLCIAHFDKSFAGIDKHEFESMLKDTFDPCCVIAGYNYTYGKNAAGNAKQLKKDSEEFGYNVEVIPEVLVNGIPVSSTKIRELLWKGDIIGANKLLGYEYFMSGAVTEGNMIGKSLGFPTANIEVPKEKVMPKSGVYAVEAMCKGDKYNAVCNIGIKPTVTDRAILTIETHLIDFSDDIYNELLTIKFKKRIRDEIHFNSKEQLSAQIKSDIESAGFI